MRPAAREVVCGSTSSVHRGVDRIGVLRIDDDIARAGVPVDVKRLDPRLTAVFGFVDAARFVGSPKVAERSDITNVRVARIDLTISAKPRSQQAIDLPAEVRASVNAFLFRNGEARELGRVNVSALGSRTSAFVANGTGWFYTKGSSVYLRPLPTESGRDDRLLARHPGELAYAAPPPA